MALGRAHHGADRRIFGPKFPRWWSTPPCFHFFCCLHPKWLIHVGSLTVEMLEHSDSALLSFLEVAKFTHESWLSYSKDLKSKNQNMLHISGLIWWEVPSLVLSQLLLALSGCIFIFSNPTSLFLSRVMLVAGVVEFWGNYGKLVSFPTIIPYIRTICPFPAQPQIQAVILGRVRSNRDLIRQLGISTD